MKKPNYKSQYRNPKQTRNHKFEIRKNKSLFGICDLWFRICLGFGISKLGFEVNPRRSRGFTLIETLVAIFILLAAITGPMAFGQAGLRAAFLARDQVVAFSLAQDAIETVKNMRDNNALQKAQKGSFPGSSGGSLTKSQSSWLSGLAGCTTNEGCNIDTSGDFPGIRVITCGNNPKACSVLYFDSVTRRFVTTPGTNREPSKFTRNIRITEIEKDREAEVVVTVGWNTNQFITDKKVIVQENIFNWAGSF
jgi:prepilin-type N-terminal cleavage/methylation domain-containing protein